jgi:hypothetical protein
LTGGIRLEKMSTASRMAGERSSGRAGWLRFAHCSLDVVR